MDPSAFNVLIKILESLSTSKSNSRDDIILESAVGTPNITINVVKGVEDEILSWLELMKWWCLPDWRINFLGDGLGKNFVIFQKIGDLSNCPIEERIWQMKATKKSWRL